MRAVILCATARGLRFVRRFAELLPGAELVVFSFPEAPGEPPFLEAIRAATAEAGGELVVARDVGSRDCERLWAEAPDLLFAVSWRYLVPRRIFHRPRLGAFVFHDSLLPAYRGFAPTVWAIVNGEAATGVTLFEMTDEVDAGDIVDQLAVPIGPDDTIAEVMERVTVGYLATLERNLPALLAGSAPRRAQDHTRASFACKRMPQDNRIDWSLPTQRIYDLVRGVTRPYAGAFTVLSGRELKVWRARRLAPEPRWVGRVPGRVAEVRPGEGSIVLTGDGALLLTEVQPCGEGPVCASQILDRPSLTLGP